MTGIWICICDEDSVFVLAKTISILIMHVVDVGEAMCLCYALEWLSDTRFDSVDFVHHRPDVFNHHVQMSLNLNKLSSPVEDF
jgi:hypothetical protein